MQKMPLTINGVDFSPMTQRLGYSVVYEERSGQNSMVMMSGDEYLDVIIRKPVLTWPLNSLTDAELHQLLTAIHAAVYVPVTYYDTEAKAAQTAYFHGTVSVQEVGVIRAGGYRFRSMTLTMRAR